MQIIRRNFALKLLAVALAIVGWAYFRIARNPSFGSPASTQFSVPIATVNVPVGYVARYNEREALVTVTTKRGGPAIKAEAIKAVLDLSNKAPGAYSVPVTLFAPDVAVQSLSPAAVTLTVEKIEQRSFPIGVRYVGSAASGIVVNTTVIVPSTALVRAPTSVLAQINALQVEIALAAAPKEIDEMVRPVAVDASGAELTSVPVMPNLVRVQTRFVASTGVAK